MVTIVKTNYTTTDKSGEYFVGDLAGLSTDKKPREINGMKVGNGCTYLTVDTGDIYVFDLEGNRWYNLATGAGEQTYTVTFDSDGGSEVASQDVVEGYTATEPVAPTKTDCEFDGWYTEDTYDNEYDFNTPVESDITLYAKWIEITPPVETYTVTFNSMGGSSVASQTVESGETLTEPADPTKTDYTFDGWYTEDTYDNEYDFDTPVENDFTLYAKWVEPTTNHTVDMTFDGVRTSYGMGEYELDGDYETFGGLPAIIPNGATSITFESITCFDQFVKLTITMGNTIILDTVIDRYNKTYRGTGCTAYLGYNTDETTISFPEITDNVIIAFTTPPTYTVYADGTSLYDDNYDENPDAIELVADGNSGLLPMDTPFDLYFYAGDVDEQTFGTLTIYEGDDDTGIQLANINTSTSGQVALNDLPQGSYYNRGSWDFIAYIHLPSLPSDLYFKFVRDASDE